MKKRIFSIALILCMLLSLLPANALAAETYELYINNFQFSSSNLTYTSGSGSATYDPGSKTLTIKNLSLSTGGANTIIQSGISGLTIKIDGTLTLNLLASKVENGVDLAKVRTNYGIAFTADTTICGANNSADKDSIIITSQCTGVDDTEYDDGTTRVGIRPMSGAKLTVKNLTVSMTDNSTGSYAGHASLFRAVAALNISGCKLVVNKCQYGVFVDNYTPVTITDTVFDMNLNGSLSSGVNFAPNAVNVMQNCSGSISGEYPVYTAGQLTISGGSKLTLTASKRGIVCGQNQSQTPGKLTLENVNVEIQAEDLGLSAEYGGSITMKSGTVTVTKAGYGLQVAEGSSFTMQGGTLSIRGADTTNCVGIKNKGTVTVAGGSLNVENVYTAIQNDSSTALSVTGGEHTLTAATCGYLGDTASELQIANTAKVTINAATGIQLSKQSGSKLTVSGGELNINTTDTGINLEDSTSTMTLSGGKVNITDKNSTPTITGMVCRGKSLFSGAEVTFRNCKIDLQSLNPNNKMTGGKLHLSGNSSGAQFYFDFEMTDGVIDGSTGALGIVASKGTTTLKGGTVNITASYPFYLVYDGIVDFAGANVTGTSTANCGLYVKSGSETEPDSSSYKISGGTVVLTSTQAGANAMYTSIPGNYGVWAGADEAGAALVETPTQPILATSKYVRFAEKKTVTLTLENVKEGTSASYLPGESFTYTAQDALSGQHFSHWELTVNGSTTTVGDGTTYSGRMPAGDATLTAVYKNCSGGTATCQHLAICSVCGKEYGILRAHDFTAEVVDSTYAITPVTCESEGTYYKSCSVCGASAENWVNATFTVPALGHDWSEWTSNGDGTHSRICGNDADHTEKEDCSGGTADCTHGPICDFCLAEYDSPAGHSYTAEVVGDDYLKDAATCTEAAVYYKSCTGCGASSKGTDYEATFSHGGPLGNVDVPYLYCDENGANWQTGTKLASEYTRVTTSNTSWGTSGNTTWYVVQDTVIIDSRVTVSGDVRLILTDGCTLTVNGGIQVQDDDDDITNGSANALTIYAQSTDKSTMGKLIAKGAEHDYNAVIGGNEGNDYGGSGGAITINGGYVEATNTDGAGIGGGFGSHSGGSGGTITINGGNITASSQFGAGIGGGEGVGDGGSGGEITINGGSVIATGVNGAGIGGGQGDGGGQGGGSGGTITINGGVVKAESTLGAAIGGGYSGGGTGGDGGKITITGGNTTASGYTGTAIGGGYGTRGGSGGEVTITGGTVTATGNARGNTSAYIIGVEGIGGGRYDITSGTDGTFQTTNNGNAVIFASSIGDQSHKADWSGIIFEGDEGKVYGNPTLTDDLTIPEKKALDIPVGKTLTVNSTITVKGILTNDGTIIGSGSITPDEKKLTYKAAPSTPVIDSVSADSITLQPIVGETAVEYSKDNTNWQSGTTFSGLTAATSYTFYARYQENGFYKGASPQSGGNAPAYTAYAAPVTNEGYSIDYAAETITVSDGYEVNTDSGFGTGTVVTSGSTVTPGQTFHVRKAANGSIPASEGTEFTIPARPAAPAAPTVKSKTYSSVTLEVILGAQYSMDGGATWQDSPEFTGLSASTAYRFVARYGATESRFASLASAELNVTTNAALSGGGVSTYTITLESTKNGTVTVAPKTASKGTTVTLTVEPDKGYTLETLTVTDKNGNEIELTNKGDGKYTFTMPASKVTVTATFMEDNSMLNFFVDVFPDDYYYDAVLWAAENDITGGVDDTHFAPNAPCTRAQIVTFLWRAAGCPEPENLSSFADVSADSYYAKAVAWAVENGITGGTGSGMFSPDATCTRAQAMAFIYRSVQTQGGGMQGEWMFLNPFDDVNLESYYGEAVMWAVANGITNGTSDTTFSPGADCTRAQIVTFLFRCLGDE